ncbi:MAG: PhoH family protein [Duodenibacillus sp.]
MPLPPAPKKPDDRVEARYFGPASSIACVEHSPTTSVRSVEVPPTTSVDMQKASPTAVVAPVQVPSAASVDTAATPPTEVPAPQSAVRKVRAPLSAAKPAAVHSHRRRGTGDAQQRCLFVLDTNVLLHDPTCLFRFQEHDVFVPMMTLEELDHHKTGTSDLARNARQVSRSLDQLIAAATGKIADGVPLNAIGHLDAGGRLFFETRALACDLPAGLAQGKPDNIIIAVAQALQPLYPDQSVVLVSKDINMRIKATTLGLPAEDYFNDKTIADTDLLYTGRTTVSADFWSREAKDLTSWSLDGRTWYSLRSPLALETSVNSFIATEDGSFLTQVKSVKGDSMTLATVRDYQQPKNAVWGVHARNMEQSMALNLLMDPEIDFVTLLGQAGTGKTLLTLAAALSQTLDERRFTEIIFTRATVSVGEEIGYLPGTEEEKMIPWMGALEDNLEVLNKSNSTGGEWSRNAAADLIRSRIRVKSMSFMRGRTFLNKFVIIDEAQNLSPKQMKTLISRAGPGTKIVCMGNIAQIDTPYLSEGSSGLTYVVDRFRGWSHAGHITLQRGERSRLADHANEVL